jgi:hypothetical protein
MKTDLLEVLGDAILVLLTIVVLVEVIRWLI